MGIQFKALDDFKPIGALDDTLQVLLSTEANDDYGEASLAMLRTFLTQEVQDQIDQITNTPGKSIWPSARTLSLTGLVTGSVSVDGSKNVSLTTSIADAALSFAKIDGLSTNLVSLQNQINQAVHKEAFTLDGGDAASWTLTHSLNTKDVIVQLYNTSTGEVEFAGITIVSTSKVKVDFANTVTSGTYRVVITG